MLPSHYNSIKNFVTYFLVFVGLYYKAQNVTIKGKAHKSYANRVIKLFSYEDYITNNLLKETQDTIELDGYFELKHQVNYTQPLLLKIDNVFAKLYVEPNYVYGITVPEIEKALDYNNGGELEVNIGIVGKDSTELNVLIYDYQNMENNLLIGKNNEFLSRPALFKKLDSLTIKCDKRYGKIKNPYFKNYYSYSIAAMNASLSRGENYLISKYILNKPIQYNHFEYMQFFNTCFKGYLNAIASKKKGQTLYNMINDQANWEQVNTFLKTDDFLKNDSLRELVALKNLWDFYYSADFNPDAVEVVVSQLQQSSKIKMHKNIANTMLTAFNKLQAGSEAPTFNARSKNGTIGSLSNFKNKWVYLNFFSTKNEATLKEMAKISALKKLYGDKLVFISICVDDSLKSYTNYLNTNSKFDWTIWYNNDKQFTQTAKEKYNVIGSEAYFLINNFGYIAQSPALAPSAGIEYKFNALFKIKRRQTKTGIR